MRMPKPYHRVLIGISILVPVLILFLSHAFYKQSPSQKSESNPEYASSSVSVEDFSFTKYIDNGMSRRFTVEGKRLGPAGRRMGRFLMTGSADTIQLKDVMVTFYDGSEPAVFISSKIASLGASGESKNVVDSLTKRIYLEDGVSVMTRGHRTLDCRKAVLDSDKSEIFASGSCVLRYEGKSVRADFINTDAALKNFDCRDDKRKRLNAVTKMFT